MAIRENWVEGSGGNKLAVLLGPEAERTTRDPNKLPFGSRYVSTDSSNNYVAAPAPSAPTGPLTWRLDTPNAAYRASVLLFGTADTGTGAGTTYMDPGGPARAGIATEVAMRVPAAGILSNVYAYCLTGPVTSGVVLTLRKNAADTLVTISLAVAATSGADTTNTATFAAGDRVSVSAVKAGAGAGALNLTVAGNWTPTP